MSVSLGKIWFYKRIFLLVAPSLLSANFLDLRSEILAAENAGADMLHIDVMDGKFVPNFTFGACVFERVKTITTLPLDVHLMVENTAFFIDHFARLSPKFISIHVENNPHLHRLIYKIKNHGIKASIAINPHTDITCLKYILKDLDMVLLMSVNPGFSGQSFIPVFEKIQDLKSMILERNPNCLIEIDGGVSDQNIQALKTSGVDICVVGNYFFGHEDYKKAVLSLKI